MKRLIRPVSMSVGALLSLAACTNPYDPGQRALGGGLIGAGTGAAIGGLAGGGRGAATGALIGGAVGAVVVSRRHHNRLLITHSRVTIRGRAMIPSRVTTRGITDRIRHGAAVDRF